MKRATILILTLFAANATYAFADKPAARERVTTIGGQRVLISDAKESSNRYKAYWRVLGVGQSKKEATADALKKAADVVSAYLIQQDKDAVWKPDVNYVKRRLVASNGKIRREEEFDQIFQLPDEPLRREWYSVPIGITTRDYRHIVDQDRRRRQAIYQAVLDDRAEDRMLLVGKILAFLLGGSVFVLGYLRLEELTKGYLTKFLGISVLVLLVILALGLFFVS